MILAVQPIPAVHHLGLLRSCLNRGVSARDPLSPRRLRVLILMLLKFGQIPEVSDDVKVGFDSGGSPRWRWPPQAAPATERHSIILKRIATAELSSK